MTGGRPGKVFPVGEDIYKYQAPDKDNPEYETLDIGPFQLASLVSDGTLSRKFEKLIQIATEPLTDSITTYQEQAPELGWDKKLIEFRTTFEEYIKDIETFLRMLATGAVRADESGTPLQFHGAEVVSIKNHRKKISDTFKDLIGQAGSLLEAGKGSGADIAVESKGPAGHEAALVLYRYKDFVDKDDVLSRVYKTAFPLPTVREYDETLPLYNDFDVNGAVLSSLFNQAEIARLVGELAEAWSARTSSIAQIFRTRASLDSFRSFVRTSYRNYAFWKYADRYIEKIRKLDSSDEVVFNAQLKELLQRNSSVDDILYRNLFVSLLQKFVANNTEE
jgi:hypothetical protein